MSSPTTSLSAGAANDATTASSIIPLVFVKSDALLRYCSESPLVKTSVSVLHKWLVRRARVPPASLPDAEEIVLSLFATATTLLVYFFLFGKRHGRRRRRLAEELRVAREKVHDLEERLLTATADDVAESVRRTKSSVSKNKNKNNQGDKDDGETVVRIFMDGAFDMMHFGHMNAFRLGRSLGTHLIVGVNSSESIERCKGAPLMNDEERITMVESCRFVDEVLPDCPYVMSEEYLDHIMTEHRVDYVIHGDDPCIVDGKDVYAAVKKRGKFITIPRTEGVSTTDFVGRMLLLTKEHHHPAANGSDDDDDESDDDDDVVGRRSRFLTTSRMLRYFSAGVTAPPEGARVVYVDGSWDMYHPGHVAVLREARSRGDYLLVGVHGDAVANRASGSNLPLMNLHERVLSVLGCRYVDDVLIDAPHVVTREMVASLNLSAVVRGRVADDGPMIDDDDDERYAVPKELGIYQTVECACDFSIRKIISRIRQNHDAFQAKFERKNKAEREFYEEKYSDHHNHNNHNVVVRAKEPLS